LVARREALAAFCSGAPPEQVVSDADSDRLFGYFCFDHLFEGQTAAEAFLETAGRSLWAWSGSREGPPHRLGWLAGGAHLALR
jgi:hypothetical protein